MVNAEVLGAGYSVGQRRVTNEEFEGKTLYEHDELGNRTGKFVVTTDAWIVPKSGIKERRYAAPNEQPVDLAARAVRRALRKANKKPEDLEGIIVATVTDPQGFPSCAQKIREKIGAVNAGDCFDVAAACAGFPLALTDGALRVMNPDFYAAKKSPQKRSGIYAIVGVEKLTSMLNFEDPDMNDFLFGDGAGAVIIGPTDDQNRGIMATYAHTTTEDGNITLIGRDPERRLRMKGKGVMRVATRGLVDAYEALMEKTGWKREEIILVPHQANDRIIEEGRERLELKKAQIVNTIHKYGNTSSASMPIALTAGYRRNIIKPETKVLIIGFGGSMGIYGVAYVA